MTNPNANYQALQYVEQQLQNLGRQDGFIVRIGRPRRYSEKSKSDTSLNEVNVSEEMNAVLNGVFSTWVAGKTKDEAMMAVSANMQCLERQNRSPLLFATQSSLF